MAALEGSDNWVWKHVVKLNNFTVQCKIDNCDKIYKTDKNENRVIIMIKGHLYHQHEKYDEEDRLKWENDNDFIWRYFDKVGLYEEKCKFCHESFSISYTPLLRIHLRQYHRQKIRAGIRKEIATKSLSQRFKIDKKKLSARCKHCNLKMDILYGTDALIHHICFKKNQHLRSRQKSEDTNVNRMKQQPIADENTNSSSHHDNLNRQALRYRETQQSNTYCADTMAALKGSDNWVWKYVVKLNNGVQCKIDNCDKIYKIDKTKNRVIIMIKGHLYHQHGKYDEEDQLKWENDNDLIWRYFNKVGLYKEKCKFCHDLLSVSYTPLLRVHLRQYHRQKIKADVRKEIADKSLTQYFEIHEEKFSGRCKRCNVEKDIFYGADDLIHHTCFKKNQSLRSRQESDDNDMNRMTQQPIADENTNSSSHNDNLNRQALGNPEAQQSNTSQYCADAMAALEESDNWVWKHFVKLNSSTVQCNIDCCDQTYCNRNPIKMINLVKTHLYHKHKIWTEEDRLKWENNNDLVWQYFDKIDLYKGKCKFCKNIHHEAYIPYLKWHLRKKHSQEIRATAQKEIATKSLSQYFKIDEKEPTAWCKRCYLKMDILYGTDALIHHICFKKNQHLRSRQNSEDNNVNRMTQQSITTENANRSSHHDDINRQTPRNQYYQQRVTSRYCKDITAALEGSNNWVRKHILKLNSFTVQCNINGCYKTYTTDNKHARMIAMVKGHLYHKHEIWNEEDRLKWENDNDLIWRYFDKVKLYEEKCKFCNILLHQAHIPLIKSHLRIKHSQEIRTIVQKEIADKSLSQYYEIDEKEFSALCKHCNVKKDIFYGTDALIHHICFKKNQSLRPRQELDDNDDPGNEENEQSNTSRYCADAMAALEESDSWVWKHVVKLNNFTVQCNIDSCDQTYKYTIDHKHTNRMITRLKGHLYHKHEIWTEEDRLKWENNNDSIWQYFDKVDLYKERCKFCKYFRHEAYIHNLKLHLRKKHSQEISAAAQKEIATRSLSHCFKIDEEELIAWCKRCNHKMDILHGTDALMHHICFKKNQRLRSRQKSENNVNRMTQQSTITENANTNSHYDDINRQVPQNQDFRQSDTSQYCADAMAALEGSDNWVWKHVVKLNNFTVQCNIDCCVQTYYNKNTSRLITSMRVHLYHKHKILTEEDRLEWENNNDLIWQYFDKVDLYKGKCKFCRSICHEAYIPNLKSHVLKKHSQRIRAAAQKKIATKSLSQCFKIDEKELSIWCKCCNHKMDIFYGTDTLIHHICFKKNQRLKSRQKSEDNNVNKMTQQSIVTENANTSSHHDDINRQVPQNQDLQQSDTYCTDVMALEGSNNWVRKHILKLDNSTVQCNIDGCDQTYKYTIDHKRTSRMITRIKGHLYNKHEIWTEEDRLKWENNNDLIWQYFDKLDLYKGKCKFCKNIHHEAYIPYLKWHLRRKHSQEIRAAVQKEIANKSLSQYFEIQEDEFSARCKRCNLEKDIFYGTDALIHICLDENERLRLRQDPEDNDVNRMTQPRTQQSIITENTNSHHDDINRQPPRNEDQQSNTTRYCADLMAALQGSDNWVWEHLKLDNSNVRCKSCIQTYKIGKKNKLIDMIVIIKAHLYHKHKIWNKEDRLKWENDNDLIWRYFDKVSLYEAKCRFCDRLLRQPYIPLIKSHLQNHHQEIRAGVRKEIADKSLSQYFEIYEQDFSARCKRCNVEIGIYYGTDALIHHICFKKNQSLGSQQEFDDNDMNRMTQQSAADENTSSHDINRQVSGNEENEQSNTRYCADLMAALEGSDNWVSQHLKLDNSTVQCRSCIQTYKIGKRSKFIEMITMIKAHLYHKHEIWNEEDRLKWENDNDLIWQYFDKVSLYEAKCKFCDRLLRQPYVSLIKSHLQSHRQEIRAGVRKEIADKSLSQYFEIHEEEFSAQCKSCNVENDIFYGIDALIHHICFKNNQSLRSRQETDNNDVNSMTQQFIADENTSSHHDINRQTPRNRENKQSNTSRQCEDITAARQRSDNWVWKHGLKLNNSTIRCNIDKCNQTYYSKHKNVSILIKSMKVHLYHKHEIWTEEDRLKWENNNDLIWQYFDKVDLYKGKCKFCKNFRHGAYIQNLKSHLRRKHSQEIRAAIQKEISFKSLSQYFEIQEEEFSARCKRCNVEKDIFYGTDVLIRHNCFNKNQRLKSRQEPEDNVNRMTQQSIADENISTNSHHDNINKQAPENRENEQSNTSRHCAAARRSDNWVWKHVVKLDNFTVKCEIDSCNKTYYDSTKNSCRTIRMIKGHLYHKHKIWTEEDRLKWENNNDLVWEYFDKIDFYKGKCKFCKNIRHEANIQNLKSHLRKKHSQEIRAAIQKEIAYKSLSQYFEIQEEEFSARCKRCNIEKDIFYGIDVLIRHNCFDKTQLLKSGQEFEDKMNRMTQQSIATENTNFHHDDINRQAPRNQDQQSNTGINNLRSDSHYHINKNSRSKEGDAADNSEYMMQQDVAAENMATHYHESTYWHDLENQDQQSSGGNNTNNIVFLAHDVSDVSSHHDDTNWQALGYQIDQQRMMQQDVAAGNMVTHYHHVGTFWHGLENQENQQSSEGNNTNNTIFLAHDVSDVSSRPDGTNWQDLGYQIDRQRMQQDVAAENMVTRYHHIGTFWHSLENQDQQSSEGNNTNNTVFLAHDVSDVNSRRDVTNWQALGYQIDQQRMMQQDVAPVNMATSYHDGNTYWYVLGNQGDQQSSEGNDMNNIVSLARDVSDVSFPHDGTNWQTLGYQVDQQRFQEGTNVSNVHRMHQFVAAENVTTNSHNDGTTLQAPGNHENQ